MLHLRRKLIGGAGLLAAVLSLGSGCATTIQPGEAGLIWRPLSSGLDDAPLNPGTYFLAPWNSVRRYSLQLSAHKERVVVLTQDDLKIEVAASIIVFPEPSELASLEQEIGRGYYDRVVRPKFRTSIRNVLAEYSMVQVSKNTPSIEAKVREMVVERLKGRHLQVHDVILEDIQFSAPVLAAIEQKLSKEQEQEQRKFEIEISRKDAEIILIRANAEAEATRVRARAQAEAQKIIEESLGQRYLQYKALDNPNAKYFFLPTGKDGVPVLLSPDVR